MLMCSRFRCYIKLAGSAGTPADHCLTRLSASLSERRVAWSLGCHGHAARGSLLPNPDFRVAMSLPRDRDMATRRVRFRSRTLKRVAMAPYDNPTRPFQVGR